MKVQKKWIIAFFKAKLNILTLIHKRSGGREAFRLFCSPMVRYRGKPGETFLKGSPQSFKMNEQWIRGYECNPDGSKTILILHGFSSSIHKFDHLATAFVQKNYRVLAFDAPAHGASDGKMVTALDYSAMVQHIIKNFGPIHAFVAHSFGGLAICLALESLAQPLSAKVVLIAPATETTTAINDAFQFLKVANPAVKEALHQHIESISGKPAEWYSVRRAVKNFVSPILWIHDYEDFITPISDVLKSKEDNNAHVQFFFTRGLGHQKIYRDATVKEKIIQFLDDAL